MGFRTVFPHSDSRGFLTPAWERARDTDITVELEKGGRGSIKRLYLSCSLSLVILLSKSKLRCFRLIDLNKTLYSRGMVVAV